MTIERQFFAVFGIKPKEYKSPGRDYTPDGELCSWYIEEVYPEITKNILLKLLCIYNLFGIKTLYSADIASLKREILNNLIFLRRNLDDAQAAQLIIQIQELFGVWKNGRKKFKRKI